MKSNRCASALRLFIITLLVPLFLSALPAPVHRTGSGRTQSRFRSPDSELTALVLPVDKKPRFEQSESRIVIMRGRHRMHSHDFSSEDGEHGYGVDTGQWTPDSRFFVCEMSKSGGHSPMFQPVVFWSRTTNRFYEVRAYTSDNAFSVAGSDTVRVFT